MPDDTNPCLNPAGDQDLPLSLAAGDPSDPDTDFNEAAYLHAFPDIAAAVKRGEVASALDHYLLNGRDENRLQRPEYRRQIAEAFGGGPMTAADLMAASTAPDAPGFNIDVVVASKSGAVFVVGWTDDHSNPLIMVSLRMQRCAPRSWTRFPRLRRPDVESAVQATIQHHYGFWVFRDGDTAFRSDDFWTAPADCVVELRFANAAVATVPCPLVVNTDVQLRDTVMGYFAASDYYGGRPVAAMANLDRDAGDALIRFNKTLSRAITAGATVRRFGPNRKRYAGSIVVALYGISDYLFVQSCLYAQGRGIADYEFIYVLNSPELAETLYREARISEMVYGLSQALVLLPGNAGFGAANNIAAQFARCDRLLCSNPDVFPRDRDWAQRHTDLLGSVPAAQTRLFGTSLYYDDGSLMHGGMYFETDTGIIAHPGNMELRTLIRVEHYGKGAPAWAAQYTASRPVPAVTGAFMSVSHNWFEKLGGFTEDFMFGDYEDADFCLKSLRQDAPPWMHNIPMWHLKGKGCRRLPSHAGGTLLNRWLFSRLWESTIVPDLVGKTPRLSLTPASTPVNQKPAAPRPRLPARGTRC